MLKVQVVKECFESKQAVLDKYLPLRLPSMKYKCIRAYSR